MMTGKMSERDSREEILKAFRLFDDDETGRITLRNLRRVAKEIGETMTDEVCACARVCETRNAQMHACTNTHTPTLHSQTQALLAVFTQLQELQEMIDEADRDGDGEVNEDVSGHTLSITVWAHFHPSGMCPTFTRYSSHLFPLALRTLCRNSFES